MRRPIETHACTLYIHYNIQETDSEEEEEEEKTDLAANDNNRGKSLPESRQSRATAVVAEDRTGPLNPIDEPDQALHGRHVTKRIDAGAWLGGSSAARASERSNK